MQIVVIGAGYVGLVSAACFAEFGFRVTCLDENPERIARLRAGDCPLYEPGLADLLTRGVERKLLSYTGDWNQAVRGARVAFLAVGTPQRRLQGDADLSQLFAAARSVVAARAPGQRLLLAIKSTVPVGTCRRLACWLKDTDPGKDIEVASNPEFLREGSALEDFLRPDRVVIGVDSAAAQEVLSRLYRPLNLMRVPLITTSYENAELIKYANNAFLATKISFINELADVCAACGGDIHAVARALGLDRRIGPKFLHPGPGYGGSCLPKDTRALISTAQSLGQRLRVVEAAVAANEARIAGLSDRVRALLGGDLAGRVVALLGLTFKAETDDLRAAACLRLVPDLCAAGAQLRAYDPGVSADMVSALLPGCTLMDDPYAAACGADVAILLTDWNLLRNLDFARLKTQMRRPCFLDLRNAYEPEDLRALGFSTAALGRGTAVPAVDRRGPPFDAAPVEALSLATGGKEKA